MCDGSCKTALQVRPVPEFETYLTAAALEVYRKPTGTGVLMSKCLCGAFYTGFEHFELAMAPASGGPWSMRSDLPDHAGVAIEAEAVAMNEVYSVTMLSLAAAVPPKNPFSFQRRLAIKRLADFYNKAVEAGLIVHGGLMGASEIDLAQYDLTKRGLITLLPYVQHSSKYYELSHGNWIKYLNEIVNPRPKMLHENARHVGPFKREGEL